MTKIKSSWRMKKRSKNLIYRRKFTFTKFKNSHKSLIIMS